MKMFRLYCMPLKIAHYLLDQNKLSGRCVAEFANAYVLIYLKQHCSEHGRQRVDVKQNFTE